MGGRGEVYGIPAADGSRVGPRSESSGPLRTNLCVALDTADGVAWYNGTASGDDARRKTKTSQREEDRTRSERKRGVRVERRPGITTDKQQ